MEKAYKAGYEKCKKDIGWISVKDRLPEEEGLYIACKNICGVATRVEVMQFMDGHWVMPYDGLSHWMPIPKLPEK